MLQRIQTIYLLILIALSAVMLSGFDVLEFKAESDVLKDPFSIVLSAQKIQGSAELQLSEKELSDFSQEIKKTPFSFDENQQVITLSKTSPLLFIQIVLTILALVNLLSYKNLKRQLRIARATMLVSLLYVIGIMAMVYFSLDYINPYLDQLPLESVQVSRITHYGFYIICAQFPFAYLALMGIKRDVNLIKSLDRLR